MGAVPNHEFVRHLDDAILPDLWRRRTQLSDDEMVSMYGLVKRALRSYHPLELHALGEQLPISDRVALSAFIDGVERWISERLATDSNANANLPRLARLAEVWEKIARAARDTADYNLERKPLVFSVFSLLAEATR